MTGGKNLNDGQAERDKGMARAYRAANPEWKAFCYECIGHARLTEEQVQNLLSMKLKRGDQTKVARELGVSVSAINMIVRRNNWRHL